MLCALDPHAVLDLFDPVIDSVCRKIQSFGNAVIGLVLNHAPDDLNIVLVAGLEETFDVRDFSDMRT